MSPEISTLWLIRERQMIEALVVTSNYNIIFQSKRIKILLLAAHVLIYQKLPPCQSFLEAVEHQGSRQHPTSKKKALKVIRFRDI